MVSDDRIWQPPEPGARTEEIPVVAVELEPVASAPPPKRRSSGVVIAAAIGAVAVAGAAAFALVRLTGDDEAGGAATPEDAGLALLTAFENEDVLGMIDVLLPGERETLGDPATELADELRRLQVLSESADLSAVTGIDIVLEDETVDVEATNVDDIVNLDIGADGYVTVDGEQLPIGDLIVDNLPDDADLSELDADTSDAQDDVRMSLPITAVEEDGRWYVSLFYSVAETIRARAQTDIPADGVTPTGGDSPEDAFDTFLDGIEALDLETVIASLNPDEFQALQRYAPSFLADAQAELDRAVAEAGVEVAIADPEYSVSGSGDTRSVTIDYFRVDVSADGETVTVELEDGCWTASGGGEEFNACELAEGTPSLDEVFADSEPVRDLLTTLEEAFSDYENPGFIVKQVDGQWYVSPFATGSEQLLAVLRAPDRGELDTIIEQATTAFEESGDELADAGFGVDNLFSPDDADFQEDAADFIAEDGGDVETQLGAALDQVACETPTSAEVGTSFGCTAVGDDGVTYEFTVEITGDNSYEVGGGTPAD
jgi:hypothetical protein